MSHFSVSFGSAGNVDQALEQCIQDLSVSSRHNFGFLYATDHCAPQLNTLLKEFKNETGIEHWVGTVGMGVCCSGQEFYDQPAVVVMLADLPANSFKMIQQADELLDVPLKDHVQIALVHGDPRFEGLPEIIASLEEDNDHLFLIGGLTSSRHQHFQIADDLHEGNMSGVLFNENTSIVTGLSQGCSPIGSIREITSCDGNILAEIDKRPALEVFREDIGDVLARNLSRASGYIFAGLPIVGNDRGDYLVRNIMGVDVDQGYVAIGEHVEKGDPIMFCRRDASSAMEDLQRMLRNLKKRATGHIRGGVYISCIGRGKHLFGDDSAELRAIQQAFDVPIVGFYANGEISGHRLYGYTGVLSLFMES